MTDTNLGVCCRVLGVSETATTAEIKRAYRKKAKALHPDTSSQESAEFRGLVNAYETLLEDRARRLFSAKSGAAKREWKWAPRGGGSFDYRSWLIERYDERSRCRLIVYCLLHDREDEAVWEYKKIMAENPGFALSRWFTREESMDYGFILCEELVKRNEIVLAFGLLERIVALEKKLSFFRLFFPEVLDFAREVILTRLEGAMGDDRAVQAWKRALDFGLGNQTDSAVLRKIAFASERRGDFETARRCFEESARLAGGAKTRARKYA